MPEFMPKTKALMGEFDNFLDSILRAALIFEQALGAYLQGELERFTRYVEELKVLESDADSLRRSIRYKLYSKMLIPENRGDVLSILENIDRVVDCVKKVTVKFDIEQPELPQYMHQGLKDLARASVFTVEHTVGAARSYLREPGRVQEALTRIQFYESEADKLEDELKRMVFRSDEKRISAKMQLSGFVEEISRIADEAENVSDRISVAAIKREY